MGRNTASAAFVNTGNAPSGIELACAAVCKRSPRSVTTSAEACGLMCVAGLLRHLRSEATSASLWYARKQSARTSHSPSQLPLWCVAPTRLQVAIGLANAAASAVANGSKPLGRGDLLECVAPRRPALPGCLVCVVVCRCSLLVRRCSVTPPGHPRAIEYAWLVPDKTGRSA
jgi:hypothetical protein